MQLWKQKQRHDHWRELGAGRQARKNTMIPGKTKGIRAYAFGEMGPELTGSVFLGVLAL